MPTRSHKIGPAFLLTITFILISMAAILFVRTPARLSASDDTENQGQDSLAMIVAMPIQLGPGVEGIALIDKQNQTLCVYQYQAYRPAHERLVLLAVRSFRYDVLLEDYNTAEPRPTEVKNIIMHAQETMEEPADEPENTDSDTQP
ncbi:MAG: hypothetical protein JW860_00980 [Sedimentisphaerales bacterium]|nr:hypothetical protein [Sedimentisphaerales bacterium]